MKIYKLWVTMLVSCFITITNQQAFSADYYWVGNGGNWSDVLHWATSSGGSTYHSVAPTQDDNVYFDANSFTITGQSVSIDAAANCLDFDWTGATNTPDLTGASNLDVYGSIKLVSGMTASFTGKLTLWSDLAGNTLDFAGVILNLSVFDILGYGEWTLTSDLSISGTAVIKVWSGTLNTNNYNIDVNEFTIFNFYNDEVYLNLGTSIINVTDFNIYYPSLSHINAGTSLINLTADNFNGYGLEFYDVTLKSSGGLMDYVIYDTNTFHTLTFEDAASVTFPAGKTNKMDSIVVNGTCAQNVTVQSDNPGSKAYIFIASGTVVGEYLNIKDMEVTGGATFTANNSVNLGNVTNWIINEPSGSTDYYWIGGTGNWTDASHWATTSGGAGNGSCIPSLNDNVYFDGNSFTATLQTVTINMEVAINSMDWTGVTNNPTLQASTYDLYMGGSLIFAPSTDMSADLAQNIYFSSDASGNSINMDGHAFSSASFYFSGSGEWDLLSDLTLKNLYFNGGTMNTNDHQISMNTTMGSGASALRNLNLGASLITTKNWNFTDSTNLNIDAGAATIQVSGTSLNTAFQDYHNILLTGSGTINIYNDASIDSLYIAPGLTVALQAGITLAIDKISATGSCGDLTVIKSRTSGVEATITKVSDTLAVEYVQLQDIHATGGAVFINYNGFDNGNNNGWTIDFLTSTTYYWVGNSGNWSDPTHWALSSGGSGNGGCYPNYYDDVVFDENSFTGSGGTVIIDQATYCHNMDWSQVTGTGNLDGTYDLHIDGSFDISMVNNYSVTGNLYFRSDEMGNTINTGGKYLNQKVYFTGSGEWTLQSDFVVAASKRLYFNNGTLHTNNFNMNLYQFYSESLNSRYLDLGNSVITCTFAWTIMDGTNMSINPGTSEIITNSSNFYGGGFDYYNVTNNYAPSILIEGNNTFHTLSMPNIERLHLGGPTLTLDSLVVPDGSGCDNLFTIDPLLNTDTVAISISSGSLTVNYWDIHNVTTTGGATFTANNSIGSGDVTGWNFSSSTIDIGNDTSICDGDSVLLDAGPGNSYLWSTGDTTQTIYASATDTYSVTVTSACGYSNAEINVSVMALPVVNLGGKDTICLGSNLVLDAGISGMTYVWSDQGQTTQTILVHPDTTTSYTVTVTDENGCSNNDKIVVNVEGSSANYSFTTDEANNTVSFTNQSSGADTYYWSFGDGTSSTEQNPTHQYEKTGIFSVSLIANSSSGECMDELVQDIQLGSDGCNASFTYYVSNLDNQVHFTNVQIGNATEFTWEFGDGIVAYQPNPIHRYGNTGVYTVTLRTYNKHTDCMDVYTENIIVGEIGSDCQAEFLYTLDGNTASFTDNSIAKDISGYTWDFNDGTMAYIQSPVHVFDKSGVYNVCLTIEDNTNNCSNTTCEKVKVSNGDAVIEIADFNYAIDSVTKTVYFEDNSLSSCVEREWNFMANDPSDHGAYSTELNPQYTYANAGLYLTKMDLVGDCDGKVYKYINVNESNPEFQVYFNHKENELILKSTSYPVEFTGISNGIPASFEWNFGDGNTNTTSSTPRNVYASKGEYEVCLTIKDPNLGAEATYCETIKVGLSTGINDLGNSIDIHVYPNPVHDYLIVELPSADFNKIEIVDITGKIVLTKQVEGNEATVENLNFESGTYILRIVEKNQSVITKLLIKD